MTQISQRTNHKNPDAAKDAWLTAPRKIGGDFTQQASGEAKKIEIHDFKVKSLDQAMHWKM